MGVLLLGLLVWPPSARAGSDEELRMDAGLRLLYRAQRAEGVERGKGLERFERVRGGAAKAAAPLLSLLVKYTGEHGGLELPGLRVGSRLGDVHTVTLPAERLGELAALPGVRFIQSSRELRAVEGGSRGRSSAGAGEAVRPARPSGGPASEDVSGSGVVVAFVDTGVDIRHEEFRRGNGTTRIKYLLDFSLPGDVDGDGDLDGAGPYGGTLFTESQIDAALGGTGIVGEKDTTGHGTHGLSVAAGDDASVPGLAPGSDLIVVKATRDEGTLSFTSTDVVNALAFVDEKAGELGRPYVVNLSLGTLVSGHDGRSLEEQAIDSLVGPGRAGKVAVVAAGNSSENRSSRYHHLGGVAYTGLTRSHGLTVPAYTANEGRGNDRALLDVWYEGGDRLTIEVRSPSGDTTTATFGSYVDRETVEGNVFIANLGGPNLENGDVEAFVLIDDWAGVAPAAGVWTISFRGEQIGETGEYHAWLSDDSVVGSAQPYLSAGADNRHLVGKPGSAVHAITVGSHAKHAPGSRFRTVWTDVNGIFREDTTAVCDLGSPPDGGGSCDGDLSEFSSPGPTRDGRVKPELVAPGERVLGAVSGEALPCAVGTSIYLFHPFAECDGLLVSDTPNQAFGLVQGTSFSAPVVTGLAARVLSTNPGLDAVQVRNVLINSAVTDAYTGAGPSEGWGYGKAGLGVGGLPLPSDLRITTDTVPGGALGEGYSIVLEASGGRAPYTWAVSSGALPAGVMMDDRGLISGEPGAAGSFSFTARVTDGSSPVAQAATRAFTLDVAATAPLAVLTRVLPPARLDKDYDEDLEASGGTPPYAWSLAGGALPPGLSLTPAGRVQGIPTALGRFDFTVQVQDAGAAGALGSVRVRVIREGAEAWDRLGSADTQVNQVAVDPNDGSHLFASAENIWDHTQNAIFESTDGGESWRPVSINNNFNGTADWISVSPGTSVTWAIRREPTPNDVYRYDPVAGAWVNTSSSFFGCSTPGAVDFGAGDTAYLFCGSSLSFRRTTDNGATWPVTGTLCGGDILIGGIEGSLSVHRPDPSFIYVVRDGLEGGTLETTYTCKSTDGGATWTEVGRLSGSFNDYREVQVSQSNPLDVVRSLYQSPNHYVERSTNGGQAWVRTLVPAPGSNSVFRRSPSNPAVLLFGTNFGFNTGLFRSTDHGQTWSRLPVKGLSDLEVTALAFDPGDANRFYVGSDQGLFYTADGGATWSVKNRGLTRIGVTGLALSPRFPNELLLGTTAGPYLSRTSGDRWTVGATNIGGRPIQPAISAADPDVYYTALESAGVYRSDNRGVTWVPILDSSDCTFCWTPRMLATDPFDADIVMATISGQTIYRSTDGGTTWSPVPNPTVFDATDISFDPSIPGRAYAAFNFDGLYRSSDSGATWQPFGFNTGRLYSLVFVEPAPSRPDYVYALGTYAWYLDPAVGSWQRAVTSPPSNRCLAVDWLDHRVAYAGQDHPGTAGAVSGIYKTIDGGRNWTRIPSVLDSYDVVALATHPTLSGTLYAATAEGGAFRSRDGGQTWTALDSYGGVGELVNVTVKHPSLALLFAGTEGYGVQVSTDGGRTFASRNTGLGNLNVNALAFDPGSATVMYAGTDAGIYKSTNTGNTWGATGLTSGEVRDLITDNQGVIRRIWGTVSGEGVAYSSDGGASFTVYSSGLASLELTSLELEIVGSIRRIWGTTYGGDGVVYSDDLGQTWRPAGGAGLTDRRVNHLSLDTRIFGLIRRIWGTTDSGVFYSDDDGVTWTELSVGLPSGVPVTSISLDPGTGEALVSLFSDREGGVFRGGNTNGIWSAFNDGLDELKVQRLTNDGGRVINPTTSATTFYAATAGDGAYANEVRTPVGSPPVITTASLAAGVLREAYAQGLSAAGGIAPYVWSVPEGLLPGGLRLAGAQITGVPVQAGTFSFTVQVSDAAARIHRKGFTLVVEDPRPVITGFAPSSGWAGTGVTISGKRLLGATAVGFEGLGASFTVVSATQIAAVVPGGAASGPITVTTPEGTATSATSFAVVPPPPGLEFYTLTPCRAVDTRVVGDGPALQAAEERTTVLAGRCAIPAEAKAVSVNVAVTQGTVAGNLRLYPADAALPTASSINYSAGQTRGNNGIVSLSPTGAMKVKCAQATGSVHFILDVNGYFVAAPDRRPHPVRTREEPRRDSK